MKLEALEQKKYRHVSHVSWRQVDEDGVILDLNTSVYFSLNSVGVFIWQKLGEGVSVGDIFRDVCKKYTVEPAQAKKDVEEHIRKLCNERLIEPLSPG